MNPRIRCAIYTRKSSEEGLEQSFNSLDAQREACEAYIKSQQHEGWQMLATHYDDGGYSGGNMERPALKQLMADIHANKVNTVVVYKVDRLTRSLADFAKLVEQFDKQGVSFVSVTQQFNTTTSMGRLTLNVLLSFAQFEREVTGERIRDKIAASKKKGMWMGGTVPLGYTAEDRKLVVNEAEATTVSIIFREFLRLGNVTSLHEWLRNNDICSRNGNNFYRGPLYVMLRNPHYIGRIKHKKETYPGQHPAIINRDTWDKVQALLDDNIQGKQRKARTTKESLFTGILFDAMGTLYTPTHANKNGRRYRYYTSQAVIRKVTPHAVPRIPAHDLESAVIDRILAWLQTPTELLATLQDETNLTPPEGVFARIIDAAAVTTEGWCKRTATSRTRFLKAIIESVVIHTNHIEIRLRVQALLNEIFGSGSADFSLQQIISIECAFHHLCQGRAIRLIVGDTNITTDASRQAILKAIARARLWYEQLVDGTAQSVLELASTHNVSPRYINKIFRLASLSPSAIEKFLTRPESLPLSLDELLRNIPMNWNDQAFCT